MSGPAEGRHRSLSRVIYDIAQVLGSAEEPDDRLGRVLELLGWVVPFDVCALFDAQPGRPRRLRVAPEASPAARAELGEKLEGMLGALLTERAREGAGTPAPGPGFAAEGMAMPIVGLGEMVGLLYVRRAGAIYSERHLRVLAIVAGQLAAYLSLVRTHEEAAAYALELDASRRAAIDANRAKDELLAVMSHKLKDPIAATLAWAHILVAARADPEGPALAVAAIQRNARALATLIDDIQRLPCVASAELRLDLRASERGRALKAAIEGPRAPAAPSPGWLNVDSGPLGPLVSSVVASATEAAPTGELVAVRLDRLEEGRAVEPAPTAPERALEGIRVLLVDDDSDIRQAFLWVLEHHGAKVTTARSAAEALALFAESRPDVLVSDLGMPDVSGYELMREIAARDPTVPAAAITAFGDMADPRRAHAAGFRMQLGKPIEASLLVAAILELAGPPRARRQTRGA